MKPTPSSSTTAQQVPRPEPVPPGADESSRPMEQQHSERTVANAKDRYRTIFENLNAPVILIDPAGRIENLNRSAAALFAPTTTPGGHSCRSPDQALPELPWLTAALAAMDAGDSVELELGLDLETTVGRRCFQVHLNRLADGSGTFTGTLAILNDETELRRSETRMRTLVDNLRRSNADLENFAYIASHDLQEPLRMVTSYLQLLERRCGERLDADGRDFLHFAVDGARRMKTLIFDLLTFSRAGRSDKAFVATDLNGVLRQVKQHLGPAIAESGARIAYPVLPTLAADPTQMVQLFQNLLSNAIKFRGNRPPQIRIDVQEEGSHWRFTVQDNGIGIAPQYHEQIFAIFQRLHGKNDIPGTGIGLALCRRIVERHGGRIDVESTEGAGATFRFTLGKEHPDMFSKSRPIEILLVEDNPAERPPTELPERIRGRLNP